MTRSPWIVCAAIGAALLSASCGTPVATAPYPAIDPQQIAAHLKSFTDAEAAGMGPGGRGEQLAVAYSKRVFTEMGLAVQTPSVPLTRIKTTHAAISLTGAGGSRSLAEGEDVVAWTRRHETVTSADGDLMFVGYGISTERQGWNDYKKVDVRGKILLMLIGDPHVGQRRLLGIVGGDLYGRSRYKFDEAEHRGAAGVLLIHLDDQSDSTWDQIQEVPTEILDEGAPGQFTPHLPIEGWLNLEAARRIFRDSSIDFDEALAKSEESNFTPVSLPVHALAHVESEIGAATSTNVIATVPPVGKPNEYVVMSTEWNNLPVGHANGGDLTDADPANQSPPGAPVVLEAARALSQVKTPHRGIVFLIVTAEAQGLLGLDSYLDHPAYATSATRAAIHVAGFNARGGDTQLSMIGVAYAALKGLVRERASDQFRVAEGDMDAERLHYFRPAKVAYTLKYIPSIFLASGRALNASPDAPNQQDMSVGVLDARLLFHVCLRVAETDNWPQWNPSRTLLDYVPGAPAADENRFTRGIR